MDLHVEEKIEEFVRQGLSRPAAAHAARRAFGNVTRVREESQDVWRWRAAHDVAGDLRYDPELATSADVTEAIALVAITGSWSRQRQCSSLIRRFLHSCADAPACGIVPNTPANFASDPSVRKDIPLGSPCTTGAARRELTLFDPRPSSITPLSTVDPARREVLSRRSRPRGTGALMATCARSHPPFAAREAPALVEDPADEQETRRRRTFCITRELSCKPIFWVRRRVVAPFLQSDS